MANASLTYEILLYLNSFYFGLLAACEVGMAVLKVINLHYPTYWLQQDCIILVSVLTLETIRTYLGRKGSLAERGECFDNSYQHFSRFAVIAAEGESCVRV